jgi:hypothetical protein
VTAESWEARMAAKAEARRKARERLPNPADVPDGYLHLHGTLTACMCGAETGMTTVAFEEGYDPPECEVCAKPVGAWGDGRPWRRVQHHEIGCVCHPETSRCQLCGGNMIDSMLYSSSGGPWHFGCSPGVVSVRPDETMDQSAQRRASSEDYDEGLERLREGRVDR